MVFFRCPLTQRLICDPVSLDDGQVCERAAIEEWFQRGHRTSPLTGLALRCLELKSVPQVKRTVAQYMDRYKGEELPLLDAEFIDKSVTAFQNQCSAEVVLERPSDSGIEVQVVPAQTQGARGALTAEMQVCRAAEFTPLLANGSMIEIDHALQALENLVIYDPGDSIKNHDIALAIRNTGGIKSLAHLAHSGTRSQRESAGFILWKICIPENEKSFAQAGAPFALYTLLQSGTSAGKTYAQNALDELEDVAQQRRLKVELCDNYFAPEIPVLLGKLSEGSPEAVSFLMQLADLATTDPDNPIAMKTCSGIPILVKLLQDGPMPVREAAAMVIFNICVPDNEKDIKDAGAVAALRALDFEGPPSAQYVASQALETLTRLEADRRFVEAQKRALWPAS